MIQIEFFSLYETDIEVLKKEALESIESYKEEFFEGEYEDYKFAIEAGLRTFILQALNVIEGLDIISSNNKFYEKFDTIEINGLLNGGSRIFDNSTDILKEFSKEKAKMSTEEFDYIMSNFEDGVVAYVTSFSDILDIDDDENFDDED